MKNKTLVISLLAVLLSIFSVQVGASLAKQLFPILGPAGGALIRNAFSAVILALIWRPWRAKISRENLKWILAYGVSLGAMNLTFYNALVTIPLGLAVAIEFLGPLSIALFASRKPLDFLWAALAVLGIGLILPLSPNTPGLDLKGVFFALAAGFFWALYILLGKKAGGSTHSGHATSIGITTAAIFILPFGAQHVAPAFSTVPIFIAAIGVGVLASALPYSLEMFALRHLPSKNFGILMSLEPAVGALSGFIFLHEVLNPIQWLAIGCIVVASMGSSAGIKV